MILHELATNAAKYGALSGCDGRLDVTWSLDGDDTMRVTWSESNGPAVVRPSRGDVGMKVMETLVAGQLKGAFNVDWRGDGVLCDINFRL